jgi:LPXTG-motif cell wall-anchored protein
VTAVALTPTDSQISVIAIDATLPRYGQGVLEGVQKLPATAESADISVTAEWQRDKTVTATRTAEQPVQKPSEKCAPTDEPSTPSDEPSTPTDEPSTPSEEPSTPSDEPSTPAEEPSTPAEESGKPPAPTAEPEFVYDETCDTLTVGITIPADWPEDIEVTFKPSVGKSKTVQGKRGETVTVDFPASKGLKVTAYPKGYDEEAATITYKAPADCETAGGGGGDSDEPTLPLTGAAAGSIAAGAGVLLAAGVALFFVARRRKVKFTA